jgi:hypothetical protein
MVASTLTGAWRAVPPPLNLSPAELVAVAPRLIATASEGLAWWRLRGSALAQHPVAQSLRDAYRLYTLRALLSERGIGQVIPLLQARGIDPLLVKGWAMARLYPEPGMRPYGDLDLCVRPECYEAAAAALQERKPDETWVELHAGYPKLFDRTIGDLYARSQRVCLGEVQVRIPCLEDHLRLLCLHLLLHGAWRPLWLCDIALVVENRPADFDWDRVLAGRHPYADWIACTIGLAHQLLGGAVAGTPVADRAQRLPRWLAPAVRQQWERGAGGSWHGPLAHAVGQGPEQLLRAFRAHWRNPVQATVELNAAFNNLPRFPYQVAATLARVPDFTRQLRARLRSQVTR